MAAEADALGEGSDDGPGVRALKAEGHEDGHRQRQRDLGAALQHGLARVSRGGRSLGEWRLWQVEADSTLKSTPSRPRTDPESNPDRPEFDPKAPQIDPERTPI